jgi:hypothetical protein
LALTAVLEVATTNVKGLFPVFCSTNTIEWLDARHHKVPLPYGTLYIPHEVQELEYRLLKYHLQLSPCAINTDNVVLDPTEAISRVAALSFIPELVSSQASVGVGAA